MRSDGKPTQMLEHSAPSSLPLRKLTYEIVHVTESREQIKNDDLVVDYQEVKAINGNGRDHADGWSSTIKRSRRLMAMDATMPMARSNQ